LWFLFSYRKNSAVSTYSAVYFFLIPGWRGDFYNFLSNKNDNAAVIYFPPVTSIERDSMPPERFRADSHQQIELIGIHGPLPQKGLMQLLKGAGSSTASIIASLCRNGP
jgi:hypothetical protein